MKIENGLFFIDEDGDGIWDHRYDPASGVTTSLEKNQNNNGEIPLLYFIIGGIILFIVVALFIILKKKQKLFFGAIRSDKKIHHTDTDLKEKPDKNLIIHNRPLKQIEENIDHLPVKLLEDNVNITEQNRYALEDEKKEVTLEKQKIMYQLYITEQNRHAVEDEKRKVTLEKQDMGYQVLKIIYTNTNDVVDADTIAKTMGVSLDELKRLVDNLVEHGLLQYNSEYEAELTAKGMQYLTSKNEDTVQQI